MYKGMHRVLLPSINVFELDTVSHSILATLHFRFFGKAPVIHYAGMGNGLVLPLLWGSKKRAVVTIDGPDWLRPKWGPFARFALRLGARLCVRWADRLIIDNHPSIEFFKENFGVAGAYIPYGADRDKPTSSSVLEELGLSPDGYVLFVGALVPDKGPDILLEAYCEVETDVPLIIVGDSPFAAEYGQRVRALAAADPRVRMLGYMRGRKYRQLVANAHIYVHPLRSDGTSPALLQAMGYGNCIVVNSVAETLSAVADAAVPFARDDPHDLARQLRRLLGDDELVAEYRSRALSRAKAEYDWDTVAEQHLGVFEEVARSVR
jgi:glycosyltransferase involved in cell wall biosynthesis